MTGKAPSTFKEAFTLLKANAQKLQDQTEPDIDHLMEIVEQSTAAYKVCKTRIDSVEKALSSTFSNDSNS